MKKTIFNVKEALRGYLEKRKDSEPNVRMEQEFENFVKTIKTDELDSVLKRVKEDQSRKSENRL